MITSYRVPESRKVQAFTLPDLRRGMVSDALVTWMVSGMPTGIYNRRAIMAMILDYLGDGEKR